MIITILATIFVLSVLVVFHESGHFLAAKLFGMRVERFSLGFPPRLAGRKIGETDYCISAIPFGGYVKISGMVDESFDKEQLAKEPQPWEYRSRPWIQRFTVIFAGPFMNIVFAWLVFVGAVMVYGVAEQVPGAFVGTVVPDRPAAQAGIKPGDEILSINDQDVSTWDDVTAIIHGAAGKAVRITWTGSGDSAVTAVVTPRNEKMQNPDGSFTEVGIIGINPQFNMRRVGLGTAVSVGTENLYGITRLIVVSIGRLVSGRESIKSLGGPVIIAKMAGESAKSGIGTLIGFMAFLSLNLGLLNLLPLPVLDGGHILFLIIEGIIRREIPVKVKLAIQQVGMILILGLTLFVIYNDIIRVIN